MEFEIVYRLTYVVKCVLKTCKAQSSIYVELYLALSGDMTYVLKNSLFTTCTWTITYSTQFISFSLIESQ